MQGKPRYRQKNKTRDAEQSQVAFRDTEYKRTVVKNQSNLDMEDFDQIDFDCSIKTKEYLFNHKFNEYVRMTLIKILPLSNKNMKIKRQEAVLIGPPKQCEALKEKVTRELERYVMKMIKFHRDEDIDEIEFHLKPDYEVKVYRIKFVELAAKEVSKHYKFQIEAQNLVDKMKREKQILVRMLRDYEDRCIEDINHIIDKSKESFYSSQDTSQRTKRNVSMTSFATIRPSQESRLSQTLNTNSSGSSSKSIHQSDDQEGPSYYEIPGVVNSNHQDSLSLRAKTQHQRRQPEKKYRNSSNFLEGYLSEPTEEDSVSVAENKKKYKQKNRNNNSYRQYNFKKPVPPPSPPPPPKKQLIEIKRYEIEEDEFDEQDFKKWQRERNILPLDEVVIQKEQDPYNDDSFKHIIKLVVCADVSEGKRQDKKEALDYYFKFKKVIMVKLKNDGYKKELIKQYTRTDDTLTIEFVKGYKSPKWKENTMWQHIIKKDYTAEKKSANTEYFQAFFIQGLKSLVVDVENELKKKMSNEPVDDVTEEILFKIDEISDHFRDNQKVKQLLKKHVKVVIDQTFSYICKVKELSFVLTALKITLLVRFDQQKKFHSSAKEQILNRLTKDFKITSHEVNFIIDKFTYEKLQRTVAIIQKQERSFKFVSSSLELSDCFNKISSIINSINTINENQVKIDDILQGKLVSQFINNLIKESQFSDVKFNASAEKNGYVFKFYGRKYVLDSIQQKIQDYRKEIKESNLTYYQIVKLKQKEVVHNQELIDRIHQKYNIYIQPTECILSCRILLTSEGERLKKIINIKKAKNLDYAPIGSAIVFRNSVELDDFNNPWAKTFKNYIKKHNQAAPFSQKNRNYSLIMKTGISTQQMLKQTLDAKQNFSKVVMVMPSNDKLLFIKQLVTVLTEEKQYLNRQIQILLLERDKDVNLKSVLGIEEYKREQKDQKVNQVDRVQTKYYVSEKEQNFFYSASGNKKIEEAIKKGSNSVILNNQDLNITHISHQFNTKTSTIQHIQSQNSFAVTLQGSKVLFTLKGVAYEMPPKEALKIQQGLQNSVPTVDISLGLYQIKLDSMQQVNVFSGYTRNLMKEETVYKVDKIIQRMQVFYDVKVGEILYQYSTQMISADQLQTGVQKVNQFLQQSIKVKEFSLKNIPDITKEDIQRLRQQIEEDETTQCTYKSSNQSLSVKLFDENDFLKVEWRIKLLESTLKKEQVKYPSYWSAQKDDIEQFQVAEGSAEFNRVQSLFKIQKIKQLIRIQNKIIYKKYYEEGQFLKNLNDGAAVKTMELFHGTRTTKPEDIYKDKEESFNINYSSDSNLLGRGIYFAEKAEYSNSYRYTESVAEKGFFGAFSKTNLYSMFLCEVYVGQSQKCPKHDGGIKDTIYRDTVKKIRYQSMTDFLVNSNIYVVYKSRRAYPMYLIKY